MTTPSNPSNLPATSQTYQIQEKLLLLEEALLKELPTMPTILRDIHVRLKEDVDTVTLLTEQECSILARGLMKQTNTEILPSILKKAPKKAIKKLGLDDL